MVDAVIHQSPGFFDLPPDPTVNLTSHQIVSGDPTPAGFESVTGPLAPPRSLSDRLAHFPDNLYDLSPESHLVRLMGALLGDAGAGQLQKRSTLDRLLSALSSTHFYDLDGFYGSIFGATRNVDEQLEVDPMNSVLTQDQWEQIYASDASFRDRIMALAKAISLGPTLPGLQHIAEALTGVPCDIYETWQAIDQNGSTMTSALTWDDAEGVYANWNAIEAAHATWDNFTEAIVYGNSGLNTRDEIYIRVKKAYDVMSGEDPRDAIVRREEDRIGLTRVLQVLRPAGTIVTIDNEEADLCEPVHMNSTYSDSNYWDLVYRIKPNPFVRVGRPIYKDSDIAVDDSDESEGSQIPVPPFSNTQGNFWSYNSDIVSITGSTLDADDLITNPEETHHVEWESIKVRDVVVHLKPEKALRDPQTVIASFLGRLTVAHPYSGPRSVVAPRG